MTKEKAKEFIAQSVKSDVDMALVADAIKALEPEPKTGMWTADKKCSRCGCSSMLKLCIENYCANCGAKMQEVEDEDSN